MEEGGRRKVGRNGGETECSMYVHTYVRSLRGWMHSQTRGSHIFTQFTPIEASVCARDRIAALLERSPIRESTLVYISFAAAPLGLPPRVEAET